LEQVQSVGRMEKNIPGQVPVQMLCASSLYFLDDPCIKCDSSGTLKISVFFPNLEILIMFLPWKDLQKCAWEIWALSVGKLPDILWQCRVYYKSDQALASSSRVHPLISDISKYCFSAEIVSQTVMVFIDYLFLFLTLTRWIQSTPVHHL
jgi:hypothetical protein